MMGEEAGSAFPGLGLVYVDRGSSWKKEEEVDRPKTSSDGCRPPSGVLSRASVTD